MAQTDTRPGFRLPWAADRNDADQPAQDPAAESTVVDEPTSAKELVTPDMTDATATTETADATDATETSAATAAPTAASSPAPDPAPAKRPTKFMADLSRAMQAAAETSRDDTMARFAADATAAAEQIRNASTDEAAAIRRQADDDVADVRDWSKAEIARIREQAEVRVAARKVELDEEMEAHGRVIEARVEQVNATVAEFESQMAAFFERLLVEEDPTRIANMAERMPDPPDLLGVAASVTQAGPAPHEPASSPMLTEPTTELGDTEPAVDAEPVAEAGPVAEAVELAEPVAEVADALAEPSLDFAAAEAEAAAFTGEIDDDETPVAPETTPVESTVETPEPATDAVPETTRVVVLGLVSVASIATFKRTLGRVPGIASIGVASGPDGEFVFTVNHDSGLGLGDAITALPGFDARITAETAGGLDVTAHDPDAAS
jgi:hypothetical protein